MDDRGIDQIRGSGRPTSIQRRSAVTPARSRRVRDHAQFAEHLGREPFGRQPQRPQQTGPASRGNELRWEADRAYPDGGSVGGKRTSHSAGTVRILDQPCIGPARFSIVDSARLRVSCWLHQPSSIASNTWSSGRSSATPSAKCSRTTPGNWSSRPATDHIPSFASDAKQRP
jgi:hypothetical protein